MKQLWDASKAIANLLFYLVLLIGIPFSLFMMYQIFIEGGFLQGATLVAAMAIGTLCLGLSDRSERR